ncbi:hypothetical protein [Herbaspirillum chlorophenolicum]|uniref:hypothetical protein n=1 Tax=Herbaspirillum chlorophenolicum TaxID=211589 RepID=UPI00067C4FFE|nr:hypothetical protein [Herbaspirillum chlorophenolicum]
MEAFFYGQLGAAMQRARHNGSAAFAGDIGMMLPGNVQVQLVRGYFSVLFSAARKRLRIQ